MSPDELQVCRCGAPGPQRAVSPPFKPKSSPFLDKSSLWLLLICDFVVRNHRVRCSVCFLAALRWFSVSCLLLQFYHSLYQIMWSCGNMDCLVFLSVWMHSFIISVSDVCLLVCLFVFPKRPSAARLQGCGLVQRRLPLMKPNILYIIYFLIKTFKSNSF